MSLLLLRGGLGDIIGLTDLDYLAVFLGAACHDLEHDGFNNPYHKNAQTARFLEFGD